MSEKVLVRTTRSTSSHVETDIVDASGNYKYFEVYDEIELPEVFDASKAEAMQEHRQTRLGFPEIEKFESTIQQLVDEYAGEDGKVDRTKFLY